MRSAGLPLVAAGAVAVLAIVPIGGLLVGIQAGPGPLIAGASGTWSSLFGADVLRLVGNTLLLAVVVTAASLALGVALALFEQRARYPLGALLASLALMPLAIPSYLLAGTLRDVLGPGGVVGRALGLPVFTGITPAAITLTLVCAPYVQILVGAALARSSAAEDEAARLLGAGPWRRFRQVVLPTLRPSLALSGLLVALYVISDFGAVSVLDCRVLTWRMYQAYETQDLHRAAVLGIASLMLVLPFVVASLLLQRRASRWDSVANPRAGERIAPSWPLGGIAYLLHAVVIGLGLVVPLATLIGWVESGLRHGERFARVDRPLLQTLAIASVGALVVVLLALVPARVSAGAASRWTFVVDKAVYLCSALPGILVATGLVLAALTIQRAVGAAALYPALRASALLLIAGYAARYLSQAFAGTKSSFLRLDVRLEESARALGAGRWRRLSRIVMPAAAPGVAAAYLLIFLTLLKELPITLVLQPIDVQTLSFRVFDRYQEAFLHDAGLAGLVLVALALGGQWLTLRWRRHV